MNLYRDLGPALRAVLWKAALGILVYINSPFPGIAFEKGTYPDISRKSLGI